MKLEQLLPATETERDNIWEVFRAEDRLWDIEAELLEDLRYYKSRIQTLGEPDTTADAALLNIYKSHLRRINSLLSRLPTQAGKTSCA